LLPEYAGLLEGLGLGAADGAARADDGATTGAAAGVCVGLSTGLWARLMLTFSSATEDEGAASAEEEAGVLEAATGTASLEAATEGWYTEYTGALCTGDFDELVWEWLAGATDEARRLGVTVTVTLLVAVT